MSQQVNISFEEHVKQWVQADNQLKALNERVKSLANGTQSGGIRDIQLCG